MTQQEKLEGSSKEVKMNIYVGIDTIKIISKKFTLNQFSIQEFFKNCQASGVYADKKLSTFTKDKDFLKYLKGEFADPYLYHDFNGLKLPAKSGSYFLNIDIDQALNHQGNNSPYEYNDLGFAHIRVRMNRNPFSQDVELKIETELSRFSNHFHYNLSLVSDNNQLNQAFEKLEKVLGIMGIALNIHDCTISRLDISEDYQATYDIETFSTMLDASKWKATHNQYGNGGLIILSKAKTNIKKLRKLAYYDKVRKIQDIDIPKAKASIKEARQLKKTQMVKMYEERLEYLQSIITNQPKHLHLLRREYRWETKKAVIDDLGLNTVQDLINKGVETCEIGKSKIHQFIKYKDGIQLDFSKELKLSLHQTKTLLSYHGIIAVFKSLDVFESLLMSGRLDDLIDTSIQSKKLYMKKLREDEKFSVNVAMRIKPLSCAELQMMPERYDVNHQFIEDSDEDQSDDGDDEDQSDDGDDWDGDDDDEEEDQSDDGDDWDGDDEEEDYSDGGEDWDGEEEDQSDDGDDWDGDEEEDYSDGGEDWDGDEANGNSSNLATLHHSPTINQDSPPCRHIYKNPIKKPLDNNMCLQDQREGQDFGKAETFKSTPSSFWFEIDNLKKAISNVREARTFKDITFDQWFEDSINEYENAFPPVAYDPLDLIPEWHNHHIKIRNSINQSRTLLINHILSKSRQVKAPKPITDKGFEKWWIKFKPSLDQEALDLMAMLSMDFEIKNVLKKSMMIEMAGDSND
jgi:hypothetical protein